MKMTLPVKTALQVTSRGKAVTVFLGLATPEEGQDLVYAEWLENRAEDLKTIIFVKNSSLFIGWLLETEGDTL